MRYPELPERKDSSQKKLDPQTPTMSDGYGFTVDGRDKVQYRSLAGLNETEVKEIVEHVLDG